MIVCGDSGKRVCVSQHLEDKKQLAIMESSGKNITGGQRGMCHGPLYEKWNHDPFEDLKNMPSRLGCREWI